MKKAPPLRIAILSLAGLALVATRARAGDEASVIALATRTLEEMAANPRTGVPVSLLRESDGVIVVPNMINAGLVIGAKFGRGVFLVRDAKGNWGNPIVVNVAGGSFGLQAGAQATELLMVIRDKGTVARLLEGKGKITLGVDAGVAAGPSGTRLGAETDIEMKAEILSYARSRGLFAGAALGGASIRVDRYGNSFYYDNFAASTLQIIQGDGVAAPIGAAKLKATLAATADPPPSAEELEADAAPVDRRLTRAAGARRVPDSTDGMPSGRPSTRRRRPVEADDDDPQPTREARAPARRKVPVGPDDPASDDPPRPAARKLRPVPPDDDPADDTPPPLPRKRASPAPAPPRDDPGSTS